MQSIDIEHPNRRQLLKLMRGEKIRVRKGEGLNLTVHPHTYNIVARAFNREAPVQIGLSQEELAANDMAVGLQRIQKFDVDGMPIEGDFGAPTPAPQMPPPPNLMDWGGRGPLQIGNRPGMAGHGIYIPNPPPPRPDFHMHPLGRGVLGKDFDKWLDKKAGRKKAVYKTAETFKPVAKAGVTALIGAATAAGATALTPVLGPMGIPVAGAMGAAAEHYAMDYIDNPNKYNGKSGLTHPHKTNDIAQQAQQVRHYENMNKQLGTNFDYMGSAGYDKAMADKESAKMSEASFSSLADQKKQRLAGYNTEAPQSRVAGSGLHHRLDRTIMGRGTSLHHTQVIPPAYVSQPQNENFNMNAHLPPQFQIHKIAGAGLVVHTHNLREVAGYTHSNPHNDWFHDDFPHSVPMPPSYTSKAEDVDFIRQSTKNPNSKPEYKHRTRRRHPKSGHGLYAGGHGHGFGLGL